MPVVFYTVNMYICVFMTCSTSYSLYDTLRDPRNIRMYLCVYVCACMYECVYEWVRQNLLIVKYEKADKTIKWAFAIFLWVNSAYIEFNNRRTFSAEDTKRTSYNDTVKSPKQNIKANILWAIWISKYYYVISKVIILHPRSFHFETVIIFILKFENIGFSWHFPPVIYCLHIEVKSKYNRREKFFYKNVMSL